MADVFADQAARTQALDPERSFIVQAPAGSGKTELLTQRYLRLLATVRAPEQIVAITFTRKAAAEMRQRIVQSLRAAQGDAPSSPHKRTTWDLARAVLAADRAHGWHIEQQPARLRIQTIDAFNATLARRLPVLAGTGAAIEPADDPSELYRAACEQLIARLGDHSSTAAQLEAVIVHLGNRVDRLMDLLASLLAKRDQWLHPIVGAAASHDLRALLEDTLRRLVERHLEQLRTELGQARVADLFELLQYSAKNLLDSDAITAERRVQLKTCIDAKGPLAADSGCLAIWRALATMMFKQDGDLYATVTKAHGFPTTNREMKERLLRLLKELAEESQLCEQLAELKTLPEPRYAQEQWRILEALLELLPAAVAELQLVFQLRAQVDYTEVALRALRTLGSGDEPTDLALALDERLQHLLVDEFQDTSFAQLDLLERLTAGWQRGDGRTVFCVGDPMQSIYRFRQAEVGLFIDLQHRGLQNVQLIPLRLQANFRSEPAIVEWVNRVFPRVLASKNDAEQGAVQYSPSVATRAATGSVHVHPFVNGDDDAEALKVTDIVRESIDADRDATIAILVSTRTRVDAIARELSGAGIEFQAVEIERLRDRPIVQDLIALTRALVHVGDRTAWLSVLRAPWCGVTLPDLYVVARHASLTIVDALHAVVSANDDVSIDGRVRLERASRIFKRALEERARSSLRVWVERTWNALGGPATLAREQDLDDVEAYFQRLGRIERAGDLEDVARLEEHLERLFARPRLLERSRVEVMTIHAAKGLEFDTVILPGLHATVRPEDRELLRWTRIAGEGGGIVLAPIKAEGSEPDSIYRWIDLLERRRVLLERARLLYVAATRAKRELHLLGNVDAKSRNGEVTLADPRKGSMLSMLWHAIGAEFEAVAPQADVRSMTSAITRSQTLLRLPPNWAAPETLAPVLSSAREVTDVDTPRPIFDWVSQTSRQVGTLVHRELDRALRHRREPALSAKDLPRLQTELSELGVPPDRVSDAAMRVLEAFSSMLKDQRGRWLMGLEAPLTDLQSELALTGIVHGQLVQGVIDRTFVDASGTRWIVDFKTSIHEGGGLDEFLDEEVVRYTPQLRRYAQLMTAWRPAQPIRLALYFPLMRAWREVA